MARLYANENFPQPVVEELRRLGHDVLTVWKLEEQAFHGRIAKSLVSALLKIASC